MAEFQCLRCGHCCLHAGPVLNIEQKDVDRWTKEGRHDILSRLWRMRYECQNCKIEFPAHLGDKCPKCNRVSKKGAYYWLDPKFVDNFLGQIMGNPRCPFLQKVRQKDEYACKIQETKPSVCRDFPDLDVNHVTENEKECIRWNCRGYKKWKKKSHVRGSAG